MRNIIDTTFTPTTGNLVLFHRIDWDGLMSAALVAQAIGEADFLPINYGDRIPTEEELLRWEKIYIVDFSLPRELNERLIDRIVWIDHHISAIKANEGLPICGIRDIGYSACELCCQYFNFPMPEVVKLLGEYDIFQKSGRFFPWHDILRFQMGSRIIDLTLENAEHMLRHTSPDEIDLIMLQGFAIMQAKRQEEKMAFSRSAWDVTIDGQPAKALLTSDMSSLMCEQTLDTGAANIVILLNRRDGGAFQCSLRVSSTCDWDASTWAKAHGGGGHKKAAGCQITTEEFLRLYTEGVI